MVRGMRGTAIRVGGGEVCQLEGEGGGGRTLANGRLKLQSRDRQYGQ